MLIVVLAVFLAYNANAGLPFVATYRVTAEVPNAASLVPGNEVRIGGVRVGLVEDVVPIDEHNGASGRPRAEARQLGRAAPRRLDLRHPGALGARPQVPRDPARDERSGLPRGSDDPGQPREAGARRVRPAAQHLRRADARGDQGQPERVRQRARRPRSRPERGDRPAQAAAAAARARDAATSRHRTPSSPASSTRSNGPRRPSPRSPRRRRTCSSTSTRVTGPSPRSPGPTCRRRSARRRRRWRRHTRDAADDPPVPRQQPAPHRRTGPGCQGAQHLRTRHRGGAARRHPGACVPRRS